MGEEKRKTATADEGTENPHKLPRLDAAAAAAAEPLLELSHPPSTEEGEATTGDSTFDIGSCEHLFNDSEELDAITHKLKSAGKPPACKYDPCGTSWSGAAGMMVCTECCFTSCIGENGDRENPQGHARWHASTHQHCVALWCDEPSKGYCFECGLTLMLGQNKVNEDDYALVPRNEKDEWGMASSCAEDFWSMMGSNAKDKWRILASSGKVDWSMLASTLQSDWGMEAGNDAVECAVGNGYIIRGMPNHGNTCYMNALLQCLLALGKLRTMILSPDARLGDIGLHLKQLFVETGSGNYPTHMLDPKMILEDMWSLYPSRFKPKDMSDSHELLTSLCDALDNEVEQLNKLHIMQGDAVFPTFGHSIFKCELLETISCKSCSHNEVTHHSLDGLLLSVPTKDPPARSKPLQVDATEAKDTVHSCLQTQKNHVRSGAVEVPIKAFNSIPKFLGDFEGMGKSTADSHNLGDKEKAQSSDIVHEMAEHMNSPASIEDYLKLYFQDGLTNCKNCSKVAADLPETNGSKNGELIMASTNLNTTVDGDQTELSDRETSPSERSSDLSSLSVESPSRKPYSSDSDYPVILSYAITYEEVTSGKSCGENDLASCSTANEKAESPEGVQEASPGCLTTDEHSDLLSAQDIQDTSTQKQGSGKQVNYDHSAQEMAEKQSTQTDSNGAATQVQLIRKLPPVLTIQLQRYAHDLSKLSGHVSFKEILHVGPFMDPSSEDKDNSSYRLVGVIEHRGLEMNRGHYIAYVRASGKQQGSGPSPWVCARDDIIRRVALEEVLRCEAYLLFYERIDD